MKSEQTTIKIRKSTYKLIAKHAAALILEREKGVSIAEAIDDIVQNFFTTNPSIDES